MIIIIIIISCIKEGLHAMYNTIIIVIECRR